MPRILVVFGHFGGGARAASGPAIAIGHLKHDLKVGESLKPMLEVWRATPFDENLG